MSVGRLDGQYALRKAGIHVVALHNHMIGGDPMFYFTHYWGTGPADELAYAIRSVLDAQKNEASSPGWDFERDAAGSLPAGWKVETTNPKGPDATWNVMADSDAPSGQKTLALTSPNHDFGGAYTVPEVAKRLGVTTNSLCLLDGQADLLLTESALPHLVHPSFIVRISHNFVDQKMGRTSDVRMKRSTAGETDHELDALN